MTPMMSSSRMTRSSSPLTLTVWPEYLPNSTRSPTFTSIGMSLPLSSFFPFPMATISPWSGFSAAVSGITMPPADLRSSSMRLTITRSCSGRIFIRSPKCLGLTMAWNDPGRESMDVSTQSRRVLIIEALPSLFKALLAAFACLVVAGVQAAELPGPVLKELRAAGIPPSAVAVVVQEVGASSPALSVRARTSMHPASVMKLLTTYAALELLGSGYRWKTEAYADGDDLALRGYGDPKLTYERFWLRSEERRGGKEGR